LSKRLAERLSIEAKVYGQLLLWNGEEVSKKGLKREAHAARWHGPDKGIYERDRGDLATWWTATRARFYRGKLTQPAWRLGMKYVSKEIRGELDARQSGDKSRGE